MRIRVPHYSFNPRSSNFGVKQVQHGLHRFTLVYMRLPPDYTVTITYRYMHVSTVTRSTATSLAYLGHCYIKNQIITDTYPIKQSDYRINPRYMHAAYKIHTSLPLIYLVCICMYYVCIVHVSCMSRKYHVCILY